MESKFGSLGIKDLVHGLFITVLSAVFDIIIQTLQNGGLHFSKADGSQLISVALIAGLSYLSKKFLSDENNKIGGSGNK